MKTIPVVTLWRFDEGQLHKLQAAAPGLEIRQQTLRAGEDPAPRVREAEVLLCSASHMSFPLAQAPNLAWVQIGSAGVDDLLSHPIMQSRVRLTTASGIHAVPIAEHALAMMLSWARCLPATSRWQRDAQWPPDRAQYRSRELQGAALGIVGYGSIGRHVARLAQALGMRILALRRSPGRAEVGGWGEPGIGDPAGEVPEHIYGPGELGDLLPQCDYLVLAVPLTLETRHLIGQRELRAMRPGAFLVNICRGGVVDEAALIAALREGRIAGAGLDVFQDEPLPAGSPLYGLENVMLTPHVAGNSNRYDERLSALFADNLGRYVRGEPLLNLVDPKRGY